ncbi:MAG: tetratricopeptide repeat protein [Mucinivorans sp.]
MKRYFLIVIIALTALAAQAQIKDTTALAGEKAYETGDFATAIDRYNQIIDRGEHSAALYYNLGNAYFKSDMTGQAILNYNRALRLDPSMEDARYNLSVATSKTVDKIDAVPEFFVITYLNGLREMVSSNTWAVLSIVFLALALAGVVVWLVMGQLTLRKVGFTVFVVFAVCAITSFSCSLVSYNITQNATSAVVINTAAPVSSSPAADSKDLFVLHEGTMVDVVDQAENWCEIQIANGEKGWIESHAIEMI